MSKDAGGPAFPTQINNSGITPIKGFNGEEIKPQTFSAYPGMNLRDYFAAKAMQASRSRNSQYTSWDDLAQDSYEIADAMLAARVKS
ncbi:hypothetical protein [Pseudomonas fulva]|uniref:hypothetical protein n=1 Tax=Pseudomonas fulva TaxID=47880 RepID=UPI002B1E5006|nr:hypothetical protein [Pseudomonas fulva]